MCEPQAMNFEDFILSCCGQLIQTSLLSCFLSSEYATKDVTNTRNREQETGNRERESGN